MIPRISRDLILVLVFLTLTAVISLLPTGFEDRLDSGARQVRAEIIEVDDSDVQQFGMIRTGDQRVTLRVLEGEFEGRIFEGSNPLLGMMHRDKLFRPGDTALTVLTVNAAGEVIFANPQDHYRLGLELVLLGLFALLLVAFGGWTGIKALLSFLFAGVALWKLMIPLFLKGHDPVAVALGMVAVLTAAIVFLVAGPTRKGLVAFLGALCGVGVSCVLSVLFTGALKLNGAVMPFSETLLYSGFGHLDLTRIYMAAVFLAASGAVMDLAMDVAASMDEVVCKKPEISRLEALGSGLTVGRAVVGTMTTTLLLAYSGGYVTLLMAFMAQGVPLANLFNLVYVAAEVLKTLVGSFGLVTVGPFTAAIGALIYTGGNAARSCEPATAETS